MTENDHRQRIDAIFLEVVELNPDERVSHLDKRCADLPAEVRVGVERLLEADQRQHGLRAPEANPFLNVAGALRSTSPPSSMSQVEPERIGDYQLLQRLGEGGMGVVYMADQVRHVKRRVALKVIKPGMDSKQVIARFESERQALSLMDHPNIAKMLDAGVSDAGRPYFVMELVKGIPITEYCDENRLNIEARLRLFESVCHAVQHAHQKGVIHRDLKPSNILVAEYDDTPVPKVIDFGLAKAVHQPLTDKTLFTHFGQIVGTLDYMSPEQAKLNQLDVDTRTDVYSLGVLLYQLIVGHLPFGSQRLQLAAIDEVLRIIREEDPPFPSHRLSDDEQSLSASSARNSEPRQLKTRVAGDLDAIVMKCLDKDRARRYQSASELAKDASRFLSGDSVEAVPPSLFYRSSKFIRRHRRALMALAFVAFSLFSATIFSARQWHNAEQLAAERDVEREHAASMELRALTERNVAAALRLVALEVDKERHPIRNLVLAREAVSLTRDLNGRGSATALEALLNATLAVGGEPLMDDGQFDYVVMEPNGTGFVTTSLDGTIRVWSLDSSNGATLQGELSGGDSNINSVVFSEDGRRLATTCDGQLRVWDFESKIPRQLAAFSIEPITISPHIATVFTIAFSRSGRLLAAPGPREADGQHPIHVWDLSDVAAPINPRVLRQHSDFVLGCVFGKDSLLYSSGRDGRVCVWDLSDSELHPKPVDVGQRRTSQTHLAFDPRGKILGLKVGAYDIAPDGRLESLQRIGKRIVFDQTGHRFASLEKAHFTGPTPDTELVVRSSSARSNNDLTFPDCGINAVMEFSQDERWILGRARRSARLFDLESGEVGPSLLRGHDDDAHWTMSPDSKWVVSTGPTDGTGRIWDLSRKLPGMSRFCLPGPGKGLDGFAIRSAIDVCPESRWLASKSGTSQVLVWELGPFGPGKPLILESKATATALAFHPLGGRLFVADSIGNVIEWDLATRSQVRSYEGCLGEVRVLAVSPDAGWLAASTESQGTRVWSLKDESSGRTIDVNPNLLAFSNNGRWMVTANAYGRYAKAPPASLWDLSKAHAPQPRVLPGQPPERVALHDLSLSSEGSWLTLAYEDSSVLTFRLDAKEPSKTGRILADVRKGTISVVYIQGDGSRVAVGEFGNGVSLLNLTSDAGELIHELPISSPASVSISDDGQFLAAGDGDGNVHVWDLNIQTAENVHLTKLKLRRHEDRVLFLKFSSDGRWLITSDGSLTCVWPLETDRLLKIASRLGGRRLSDWERKALLPASIPKDKP